MSVDLEKNRNDIINAWNDVVDTKSDTDWVLFGYEGHTNILKVISTGNGGLIELTEELNSGKILYAFVKITNDKTNLTKYLLINWQGEGAPTVRKGTCANHIRDISKILTGAHLTLNARTEDDIDSDRILEKLNSIRFAVKENKPRIEDEPQKVPIGTNYSRVIPSKEINSKDRDSFWKKAEEEERMRIESERGKQMNAKLELEKAQRLRETQAHSEREQKNQVDPGIENNNLNGVKFVEPKSIQMPKPSIERSTTQAEEMRQQRNQEAKQLIGSTVNNAKAIFAQNTAAGQLTSKITKTAPAKPVRNSITRSVSNQQQQQQQSPEPDKIQQPQLHPQQKQEELQQQQQQQQQEYHQEQSSQQPSQPDNCNLAESTAVSAQVTNNKLQHESLTANDHHLEDDDSDPYSTIKRSPYTKGMPPNSLNEANGNDQPINDSQAQITIDHTAHDSQQNVETDNIPEDATTLDGILQDQGLRARALYDYQADDESEITFDPGDIITHIDQIDEGWWQGLGPDGTYGLFPANYVELLND